MDGFSFFGVLLLFPQRTTTPPKTGRSHIFGRGRRDHISRTWEAARLFMRGGPAPMMENLCNYRG